MHPIAFTLPFGGGFPVHTYGVMMALGAIAMILLGERWGQEDGMPEGTFEEVGLFGMLLGVVGARLEHVRVHWPDYAGDPARWLNLREGGMVFYGSLFGLAAAVALVVFRKRVSFWRLVDVLAILVCIGHALGRMGCFFAGCCYGLESTVPWAVVFTDPASVAPLGVPVHPTQLYAVAYLLSLSAFLMWLRSRRSFDGQVFAGYLLIYPLLRSLNEFFRDDPRGYAFESILGEVLTNGQAISLGTLMLGCAVWFWRKKRQR